MQFWTYFCTRLWQPNGSFTSDEKKINKKYRQNLDTLPELQ